VHLAGFVANQNSHLDKKHETIFDISFICLN